MVFFPPFLPAYLRYPFYCVQVASTFRVFASSFTSHNFLTICLFFCPSDRCPCPGKPLKGQLNPTYSGFWQAQGPIYTIAGWSMSPSCLSCKGSKWAFKQFFSYLSQETVLGIFWQALFPPVSLPYTGVYFCFGFLLKSQSNFVFPHPQSSLPRLSFIIC